jgi:hypothetical protein
MLTNRTTSGLDVSGPNGFSISNRKITSITERELRFKRQLLTQLRKKFCAPRPWVSNYEYAGSANIHDIVGAQFSSENAWTKSPVLSNIDAYARTISTHVAGSDRSENSLFVTANADAGSCSDKPENGQEGKGSATT